MTGPDQKRSERGKGTTRKRLNGLREQHRMWPNNGGGGKNLAAKEFCNQDFKGGEEGQNRHRERGVKLLAHSQARHSRKEYCGRGGESEGLGVRRFEA